VSRPDPTSVDYKGLSGHECGVIGGEEGQCAEEIRGLLGACDGLLLEVQYALLFFPTHFKEGRGRIDAGVVYKDIHFPEAGHYGFSEVLDRFG
jgi:hypothetical protein